MLNPAAINILKVRISDPHRYNETTKEFEVVGGPEQLFLDANIQHITVLKNDQNLSIQERVRRWLVAWGYLLKLWDSGDPAPSGDD